MPRKSKHNRPQGFTKERATFWRVSDRVMQLWLNRSVPVDSVEKMIAWYAGLPAAQQNRLTATFKARVTELRLASGRGSGALVDPEWASFEAEYSTGSVSDQTALAEMKKQAAFYSYKQRLCSQRNDHAGASAALNQLKDLSSVIHDMELRAQKLGRDLGDLVPRKTLEEPARFIGYHLLRCADAVCAEISAALTQGDVTGARLTAEEIVQRIDPILLNAYVLRPIERAAAGDNTAAPPDWLVAALRAGAAEVIESATLDRMAAPAVPGA
jgi:hypothetical protein